MTRQDRYILSANGSRGKASATIQTKHDLGSLSVDNSVASENTTPTARLFFGNLQDK